MTAEAPEDLWPVDEHGRPLPPRARPGYYPGFSTLAQQAFWDEATRRVVLARVSEIPPIRFFTQSEVPMLEDVVARILPQDDRDAEHRIPIVPFIDERLQLGRIDGYRYEGMPPDGEAHRLGLVGIERVAEHMFERSFLELDSTAQDLVLATLHDGKPPAGEEVWSRMQVHRYWMLLVGDVCGVYYAHPWAWDEIGFGGPAYPRGYMRLERGQREPWEVDEERYAWSPPPSARSHQLRVVAGLAKHGGAGGQGGTH